MNVEKQVGWGTWHHLLHQFGEIPLAESLDQAVQFVEVIPPLKSMEEVKLLWWNFNFLSTHFSSGIFLKPVRRRKSFWKSIGPNLSRSEKRNKTRPNWARKVLKLTMGDMFNCSCPPCPCPRLWVGEVAWLRGEDKDVTEEEGIFVAETDGRGPEVL